MEQCMIDMLQFSHIQMCSGKIQKQMLHKQVDILISKNQALQILYHV